MSDFKAVLFNTKTLISIPQYKMIMQDWFDRNPDDQDSYEEMIADY